jgi:YHS domain-containing protein
MIISRKIGLAMAALFSAVLVAPVLADGASDFQANARKGQGDLDKIASLIDSIKNHSSSASASNGGQQVADTEETMKCPVCGMTMTAKATASNSKSVTIKGKTYYCCAGCDTSKVADKPAAGRQRNGQRRRPAAPKKP